MQQIETETSAVAALVRARALRFADGLRFELPPGNRLATAGDVAEIRALLEGWPRSAAAALKAHVGPHGDSARVHAILDAWRQDPDLVDGPAGHWERVGAVRGTPGAGQ